MEKTATKNINTAKKVETFKIKMDLITIFKQKRPEQRTTDSNAQDIGNEPCERAPHSCEEPMMEKALSEVELGNTNSVKQSTALVREPTSSISIDDEPKRLFLEDDYNEIFQEVLHCEYLCRECHLRYDRKVYLGDQDLHKRKEFLLDYLYSLNTCLEDSLQERRAIQEIG